MSEHQDISDASSTSSSRPDSSPAREHSLVPRRLAKAISRLLRSDIARVTLAEVVDGLPLADTVRQSYAHSFQDRDHPIYQHTELSRDSRKIVEGIVNGIDRQKHDGSWYLAFDPKVREPYQFWMKLSTYLYL